MRAYLFIGLMFVSATALAGSISSGGVGSGSVASGGVGSGSVAATIEGAAAPDSCGSSVIASDTFTEGSTGNIALNTHTKDSGGSWTTGGGSLGINDLSLDRTNDVVLSTASGSNGAGGVIDDSITCYNYKVEASMRTGSTGTNRIGVLARYDLASGNGYWLRITGSGTLDLYKDVGGSATVLLSSDTVTNIVGSFSSATNYDLRLDINGSQLTAYINSTLAFPSVTDTSYTTGKPGIKITNTSPRGDGFVATYLP